MRATLNGSTANGSLNWVPDSDTIAAGASNGAPPFEPPALQTSGPLLRPDAKATADAGRGLSSLAENAHRARGEATIEAGASHETIRGALLQNLSPVL